MTTPIDKLALVHVRDRRVLVARSRGRAAWYLPGGKREAGESDAAALVREIAEELAVDLDLAGLVFVGDFEAQADGKPAGTFVRLRCYRGELVGEPKASAEIEAIAWIGSEALDACSPAARIAIEALREQDVID